MEVLRFHAMVATVFVVILSQGRPTLAPEDRPHDPYIEPWYGSPLLWEKECEYGA